MSELPDELERFLNSEEDKSTLRLITCGSVDDGKSTLIGRLLYDSKLLFNDQIATLWAESKTYGTAGDLDFALLVDGLQAEREQGITIDVAYRFFATAKRRFIVADTPGHQQYTRNMATGASGANLAIILVDARRGLLAQTRRHAYIVSLFGIRHVVLAINKMDLVGYEQAVYHSIAAEFSVIAQRLGFKHVVPIPMSALQGDNVISSGTSMPWYRGPTLIDHLETVDVDAHDRETPFRMPVQRASRPSADFRGFMGRIVSGTVATGDEVTVYPGGQSSKVKQVLKAGGDAPRATSGESITLTLHDEIDISRGSVLAGGTPPLVAHHLAAHLLWMDQDAMLPGRYYRLQCGTASVNASISALKHRVDVDTMEHAAATTLLLNEVGWVNLHLETDIACDAFQACAGTGAFILIDLFSNRTVGAGVIEFALRRSANVRWQALDINKTRRSQLKSQRPCALWFTGLSGAGKSTIANLVDRQLFALGQHAYVIDGDNLRHGLNSDLGFTIEDRVENVRRAAEVTKLFLDSGLICLTALISPFRAERQMARRLFSENEFCEIYIKVSLEEAERRDPKGLYARARAGQLPNFTGVDSPYEEPEAPEILIDTIDESAEAGAQRIIEHLRKRGHF